MKIQYYFLLNIFVESLNSQYGTNFAWQNGKIELHGNATLSYYYSTLQFESQLVQLTPLNPVRKFECYLEAFGGLYYPNHSSHIRFVLKEDGALYLKATIIDINNFDVHQLQDSFRLFRNICDELETKILLNNRGAA